MSQTKAELVNGLSVNEALADAITVDSSGNLGVNTSSPASPIHSHLASSDANRIRVTNSTTGATASDGFIVGLTSAEEGIVWNYENSDMLFGTNNTERMRINSSGNVGIGTTSPTRPLHIASDEDLTSFTGTTKGAFCISNSDYASGEFSAIDFTYTGSDNPVARIATKITSGGTLLSFGTSNNYSNGITNEAITIDSSRNVGIGTNNPSAAGPGISFQPFVANDTSRLIFNRPSSGYLQTVIEFLNNGSTVGSIKHNNSSTQYNTSSDYRLKENVVEISDGITRLKTLKPCRFNFKVDTEKTVDGFLAHEVTAVPEAISGIKDEVVTEDNEKTGVKKGDPIYQGIDQSKLVPLLTAALQEEIAKREALEARVATLEAA
tara:strand:- start:2414 stop:3550 length:1137 start_codon:yes stop_codon:yes gene_type:complete